MIICMLLATVSFVVFAYLFLTAGDELTANMIECLIEMKTESAKNLQSGMLLLIEQMKQANDMTNKKSIKKGQELKKKLDAEQKCIEQYQNGKLGLWDMIPLAGYRLMQLLKWDATNSTVKKLNQKCMQYMEKKEAVHYTYYVLAALIGYTLFGVLAGTLLAAVTLSMGLGSRGIVVALAIFVVVFIIGYLPYDNIFSTVAKRAEAIENQFPQAISQMTLLTIAGMEINQAWKLACQSNEGVLYDEMRRVVTDLDNNVPPTEAYARFITRCNNNYTTKLGTAIMQNIYKGNSEIATLFRSLNDESWMEHKHSARRRGEAIQSKLMAPTMLMFLGILIMIMVPVLSGFDM